MSYGHGSRVFTWWRRRVALLVAGAYALLAGLYIWLSGLLVQELSGGDAALLQRLETVKGWACVLLTAFGLYALVRALSRSHQRLAWELAAREELERQLRDAARRWQALVDMAPDAVLIHQDGVIRFANPAAARLWGAASPQELVGQPAMDLVAPEFRPIVAQRVQQSLASGTVAPPRVEEFLRLDGTVFRGEAVAAPVLFDGRPAMEVFIRDVSERERVEKGLRERQRLEAVGSLAAGIAHDFNNLLQAAQANVFRLKNAGGNPAVLAAVAMELEGVISRGAALARQLLLFAKPDLTQQRPLDLNQLLETLRELVARLVPENVSLRWELSPDPLPVVGDPSQLEQVVWNLIINAAHAMPDGGTLTVRTERRSHWACLEVRDTGTGIPEELKDRIFEPFFTTKPREKGTGLGLAVVHGVVTAHGGTVEVESQVGKGSSFRVVLPLAPVGAWKPATAQPQAPQADGQGRGERVLVVEDETASREALAQVLEMLGYRVVAVASAEDAGKLPAEEPFDLLLTDYLLPGASGTALAAGLLERWPEMAVVFMSGYGPDLLEHAEKSVPSFRFLQKPFTIEALAVVLREALAARGRPAR